MDSALIVMVISAVIAGFLGERFLQRVGTIAIISGAVVGWFADSDQWIALAIFGGTVASIAFSPTTAGIPVGLTVGAFASTAAFTMVFWRLHGRALDDPFVTGTFAMMLIPIGLEFLIFFLRKFVRYIGNTIPKTG